MIDIRAIKAAAEAVKHWSLSLTHAWLDTSEDDPAAVAGHIDEEGNTYPVVMVDCDQYSQGQDSLPLAKFIATANPTTVSAMCDEIERLATIASELQDLCDRQAKRLALEALTEPSDSDGESFYEAVRRQR
jgi:hypothetical protein